MNERNPRAVKQRLQSLADAGVQSLPKRGRAGATRPGAAVAKAAPPLAAAMPPAASAADRMRSLAILRQQVVDCTQCSELAGARTQTVFGVGRPDARLCLFGEAPGADEDASGEPFVGRAGQLLTKIIEACTLSRDDVYILNVLKCRPPGNRTPLPDEVANCRSFFERQFATISPEFICCLGTTAAQALLQTTEPIGKLRRRWFTYGSAQVICTYHPSYLLRNPAAKRDVWDDMKLLMAKMGLPVPQ
ncbi:MAG: uracil-DNA glycosylase family protein [Planctomycetaceae bacterium]